MMFTAGASIAIAGGKRECHGCLPAVHGQVASGSSENSDVNSRSKHVKKGVFWLVYIDNVNVLWFILL
jgi:hypothetical protein